ncbi:hypothetical protein ACFX11_043542 [Malus domestica]
MKRKDIVELDDDDFSPFSKSRRLDGGLFATVNEYQSSAAQVFEEMPTPETSVVMQTDDLPTEPLPSGDEKALVLYNPANTRFFKAPDSRDFSVIVNSDLIPGLRDHIYSWGYSKSLKPVEDRGSEEENKDVSNGCMAVVPWVAPNFPPASRDETQIASQSEPMEVEMMDTDDNRFNGAEVSGFSGTMMEGSSGTMMEGSSGLHHWHQQQQLHWMEPQLLQNSYTPVTW